MTTDKISQARGTQPLFWADSSGNFWLFGGFSSTTRTGVNLMNDLWEFTPSSSQWTWMGGATTAGQSGVYGTIGIRGSSNFPGGRAAGAAWYTSGTAYLYGGFGVDAAGVYQPMNDLWLRK